MNNNIVKYILIDLYVFLLFILSIIPAIGFLRYLPSSYYINIIAGGVWLFIFIFFFTKELNKIEYNLFKKNDLDPSKKISSTLYLVLLLFFFDFLRNGLYSFALIILGMIAVGIIRDVRRRKIPTIEQIEKDVEDNEDKQQKIDVS